MHFIRCQFITWRFPSTLIIYVFFWGGASASLCVCMCFVTDGVLFFFFFFFFFFFLSPFLEQAVRVRRKECAPPNYPNRAQWIGLTFCPLPLQTHPQVGAQRSTLYRWKTGGTRLHRHKDTDILTGAHTLYLNTSSCLFACFSHSLRACAPRVFYLLALDSCQTLIEGWHEYLAHVFFFFPLAFRIWKHSCFFCEWCGSNEACFSLLAAVTQTCSAPCPPLTCTCSLMSWRRKRRWRGGPLLPSGGPPRPLPLYLTVTSPQPPSRPRLRRRCSRCSRTHTTATSAGNAIREDNK